MKIADYPHKATTDAATAMIEALAAFVAEVEFSAPVSTGAFKLQSVSTEWAEFRSKALPPCAAVLADRPTWSDSQLTPEIVEASWGGGDPTECDADTGEQLYPLGDGTLDGPALFKLCEVELPVLIVVRAKTKRQRSAILRRLEAVFVEDGSLVDPSTLDPALPASEEVERHHPTRTGKVLPVPGHFDRPARFTLLSTQRLDAREAAEENRWVAQLELRAEMSVCALRRVRGMKTIVTVEMDGSVVGTEGE